MVTPPRADVASSTYSEVRFGPDAVEPGDLYVNLYGDRRLGRRHLRRAAACGAAAVCCEMDMGRRFPAPVLLTRFPRRALSASAAFLHDYPSRQLDVIGITGTKGKSTTAVLVSRCLELSGIPCGAVVSEVWRVGGKIGRTALTTPDAPCLQRLLRRMADGGARVAVVEVSSHSLAHERVRDVDFHMAAVTSISPDHTDFHPDMEHYCATKGLLFEKLPAGGLAFANADDEQATRVAARGNVPVLGVGLAPGSAVRIEGERVVFGPLLADATGRETTSFPLRFPVPGEHNRSNAAIAAALAYAAGASREAVEQGISTFPGWPRRLQVLYEGPFRVIDDTAAQEGSLEVVFRVLAPDLRAAKGIIVVNSVRRWGPDLNARIGGAIARSLAGLPLKAHIFTPARDVPRPAAPATRADIRAYVRHAPTPCHVYRTLREAVKQAFAAAEPGDLMLVFGAQSSDPAAQMLRELIAVRDGLAPDAKPAGWVGLPEEELIRKALLPLEQV